MFSDIQNHKKYKTVVKVIGLGGGGCNAIARIHEVTDANILEKVVCIAANTDAQHLEICPDTIKILLGSQLTQGLGAGSKPEIGEAATLESKEQIEECLEGTDMLIITASLGGGTGTGAAPVVAHIARSKGILVVGIVTLPFHVEGKRRWKNAISGLQALEKVVNTLIVVRNENLVSIYRQQKQNAPLEEVLYYADEILRNGVNGFTGLIYSEHKIDVDFSDIVSALQDGGWGIMGIGYATGENAAIEATKRALNSPLLGKDDIKGAKQLILHATMQEATRCMKGVREAAEFLTQQIKDTKANVKFGLKYQNDLEKDAAQIIVIATGFEKNPSAFERSNERAKTDHHKEKKVSQHQRSHEYIYPFKGNIFRSETNFSSKAESHDVTPPHQKNEVPKQANHPFSSIYDYEKNRDRIEKQPASIRRHGKDLSKIDEF